LDLLASTRLHVYRCFVDAGCAPSAAETAAVLGESLEAIEAAYRQMAESHILVLHPNSLEIWMAMPFSNVPTPFHVSSGGRSWYANCAWDAFGIPALLGAGANITTTCADCGESIEIGIRDGRLSRSSGVVHFALPPSRWWEDIGFT
jgi:hypothetical protein